VGLPAGRGYLSVAYPPVASPLATRHTRAWRDTDCIVAEPTLIQAVRRESLDRSETDVNVTLSGVS